VDEHRAVGLEDEQAHGLRQDGAQQSTVLCSEPRSVRSRWPIPESLLLAVRRSAPRPSAEDVWRCLRFDGFMVDLAQCRGGPV
jgi:hypothetical protein